MGMYIVLEKPALPYPECQVGDEVWENNKYTGRMEFYILASKDATYWGDDQKDPVAFRYYNDCYRCRPKDLAKLRESVKADPDCQVNLERWLKLIDVLEANPDIYIGYE